jgi:GNAT superfamily N-acetyltransferase
MNDTVTIRRVAPDEADACVDALADILVDCVEGGYSIGFMSPIRRETALAFWRKVTAGVQRGERVLLVAEDAEGIAGTVQLILDLPENQPHRGDVVKMLVHSRARRRGIAQKLMRALDEEARRERRSVLVLDAVTGGDASRLYEREGWQRAGDVPKYALMPGGAFCSTTYYYKHLDAGSSPA